MDAPFFCPLAVSWGDVATWFSGAASAAAVIVALHLARRADKPKAKAWLSIMATTDNLDKPFVSYGMSNLDLHPIRVTGCSIQLVGPGKWGLKWSAAIANDWRHSLNWPIPSEVPRGQTFRYATENDPFASFLMESKLPAWLTVWFVRASVDTPWGPIRCKVSPDVRRQWREQIVVQRQNQKASS
ncbi:hypothetical protein I5U65_07450 [Stenotrophomonas maltophilia]|nr:hypothetical protein [Stenotrophomonas maltophilia]